MKKLFEQLFRIKASTINENTEMKYLVFGLGNKGIEYENTRHNIGFLVVDELAKEFNQEFKSDKLAHRAEIKYKGRVLVLIKPTTYMNLSGKAVNYWMQKEKVTADKIIVVVDDLAIPFGTIRIKAKGSDGGHNGISNINQTIGGKYPRIRFGIGNEFSKGQQVDYVLGEWSTEEYKILPERIEKINEAIKSFVSIGLERTMNYFNGQ